MKRLPDNPAYLYLFFFPFYVIFSVMLKTLLYDYMESACSTVAASFEQLQHPTRRQKAIHQLRVGSKKIRALLALAQQIPGYHLKKDKYLTTLKILQQIGGISRDTQLQELSLARHEKTVSWRFSVAHLLLKTKLTTLDATLESLSQQLSVKKLTTLPKAFKAAIADIEDEAAIAVMTEHVAKQYRHILLPDSNAPDTTWHELRKNTKRLYYQLSIITQLPHHTHQHRQQLQHTKKAGDLLGQWHDASELLLFVKNTATKVKKEKTGLSDNVSKLIHELQRETTEKLADSAKRVHLLTNSAD